MRLKWIEKLEERVAGRERGREREREEDGGKSVSINSLQQNAYTH